ncbi:hypothetical protein DMA12_28415 [Amycolatopsis balhimycina DSM 5908]|uniref:Uncharacterized protein n=1 Tax=Amycolatopsis balhimycina DSM 5908 TaxID=1081091 RepID=A0A428WAB9_AMYBA|nr:hypothetical protein [Amycolatopsis balhimycina]RSM40046.1 hypothetical protein DMA12_28415 [Amycolatopsis balhimycina DSM 5908]
MTDSMRASVAHRMVPPECRLRLVQHIPFLTSLDAVPARIESSEPGLDLQMYTPALEGELRRYLPHRVATFDVTDVEAGGGEPRFRLRSAKCRLWDSGACVLEIGYDVDVAGMSCQELRHAIDRLHELAPERWSETAARCADHFAANLGGGRSEPTTVWVHDTLIFSGLAARAGEEIADYYSDGGARHELTMERHRWPLRLGLTACLVTDDADCRKAAIRVIEAHQALWATAIEYDRQLFRVLAQEAAGKGVRRLEEELDELLRVQRKISDFASKVSATPVHLSRLDQQLWVAVRESWRLQDQIDGLTGRLGTLRSSYSELANRIGTRRSRRLSYFLVVFTLLSAVSTAASLRVFVQQDLQPANADSVRWLLVFAGIAAVLAVVLVVFVARGYRRRR